MREGWNDVEGWGGSTPRKRYKLSELLAGMSEERHGEIDFGPPVGREFGAEGWDA